MNWAAQQDQVPSPHPKEQSGTVCSQPQTAGVWDGVTEHSFQNAQHKQGK